jgi:hypothetical protein
MSLPNNGFESGDFSAFTSHYVTGAGTIGEIIPAAARTGGFGFHIVAPVSSGNMVYQDLASAPMLYTQFAIKVLQLTTSTAEIVYYMSGTPPTNLAAVRIQSDGKLRCYNRSGATGVPYTTSTKAINDGLWHTVKYEVDVSTVGYSRLWIDGSLECTTGPYDNSQLGLLTRAKVGAVWNYGGTLELDVDDVIMSATDIVVNTYHVDVLQPDLAASGILSPTTGVSGGGYPYIGFGSYDVPVNGYVTMQAVANPGYQLVGWNYWDEAGVLSTTFFHNNMGFHSGSVGRSYRFQPVFAAAVQHTVIYSSTPVAVPAVIDGSTVPSGSSEQAPEGSTVNVSVPLTATV